MWFFSLSQNVVLYCYPLLCLWWCERIECLCDGTEGDEWRRYHDIVFSYSWLSHDMSEGEPSASRPQLTTGHWNHRESTESETFMWTHLVNMYRVSSIDEAHVRCWLTFEYKRPHQGVDVRCPSCFWHVQGSS